MSNDARDARIEARLGTFDAAMVVVSLVIGIGMLRTPALVAQHAGSAELFFAAWGVGGLVSLMGALTFAEIGARHPCAGGYYRVVADVYHPRLAFMLNWAQALMQGAGAAGVAFIGAEYLLPLLPASAGGATPLFVACVLMLALLAQRLGCHRRLGRNVLSLLKIVLIGASLRRARARAGAGATGVRDAGTPVSPPSRRADSGLLRLGGYHLTMNLAPT